MGVIGEIAMLAETENAVRCEMLTLLYRQLEALNSSDSLTDSQLMECYRRQARIQELREMLEASSNSPVEITPTGSPTFYSGSDPALSTAA
jgi:hypothetical protein